MEQVINSRRTAAQKRMDQVPANIEKVFLKQIGITPVTIEESYPFDLNFSVITENNTYTGRLTNDGYVKKNSLTLDNQ